MAAEVLASAGLPVTLYEQKKSPGRKLLIAGRGGLNLTHTEALPTFLSRYREAASFLEPALENFTPEDLRAWCNGLGQPTFVGTSGRVFPESFKATPLLRAWLARLESLGVTFKFSHRWLGWHKDGTLIFTDASANEHRIQAHAALLALGGASWPHLGSDGTWTSHLDAPIRPWQPSNCGFRCPWSDIFREKFSGHPVKSIVLHCAGQKLRSEMMITNQGVEGSGIYALSADLREIIRQNGSACLTLDLRPDMSQEDLNRRLQTRGRLSFGNYLRKATGLSDVAAGLVMEKREARLLAPNQLAALIKNYPLTLDAPFDIARAISSAGGLRLEAVDPDYMLKRKPGVFVAGEMLDWEAPTGGYLLQASFSTAVFAAQGLMRWLRSADLPVPASGSHNG